MGMSYYSCQANELSKEYARSFLEFAALESYVKGIEGTFGEKDMSEVAYLLSYDDDVYGEMTAEQKQKIRDLWDEFKSAFSEKHPSANIYIEHIGDEVEGPDAPQDGWYIGISNYLIKNPALEDLRFQVAETSWVSFG